MWKDCLLSWKGNLHINIYIYILYINIKNTGKPENSKKRVKSQAAKVCQVCKCVSKWKDIKPRKDKQIQRKYLRLIGRRPDVVCAAKIRFISDKPPAAGHGNPGCHQAPQRSPASRLVRARLILKVNRWQLMGLTSISPQQNSRSSCHLSFSWTLNEFPPFGPTSDPKNGLSCLQFVCLFVRSARNELEMCCSRAVFVCGNYAINLCKLAGHHLNMSPESPGWKLSCFVCQS